MRTKICGQLNTVFTILVNKPWFQCHLVMSCNVILATKCYKLS